jgi:hypothetical protein
MWSIEWGSRSEIHSNSSCWVDVTDASKLMETVACSIAIKMGIFKALNEASSQSINDLAKRCGSDPILMGKV